MGPTEITAVLTILVMLVIVVGIGIVVVPRILYMFRRNTALKAEDRRIVNKNETKSTSGYWIARGVIATRSSLSF